MKKGFTLIELLVVVLIIGILSSIALPQYQKAVDKARGAEALTAVNALEKAQTVYYLENREFAYNPNDLAIEVPALKHFGSDSYFYGGSQAFYARKGSATLYFKPYVSNGKPQFERYCYGNDCQNYFACKFGTGSTCYF